MYHLLHLLSCTLSLPAIQVLFGSRLPALVPAALLGVKRKNTKTTCPFSQVVIPFGVSRARGSPISQQTPPVVGWKFRSMLTK